MLNWILLLRNFKSDPNISVKNDVVIKERLNSNFQRSFKNSLQDSKDDPIETKINCHFDEIRTVCKLWSDIG